VLQLGVWFAAPALGESLLELTVKNQTYRGKLVARNNDYCWLMDRDGKLSVVPIHQVDQHRKVATEFRRFSSADMRDQLRREFGNEFDFAGTSHFIVGAAKGRAGKFAPVFEEIYRSFHRYLSTRGVKTREPEFPLVAIVFPDQQSFARYSRQDGVNARQGLMGYYIPTTNRVALFESSPQSGADFDSRSILPERVLVAEAATRLSSSKSSFGIQMETLAASPTAENWYANIEANLQDTIVHETTHQVAFNTGLHSRLGESPKWVVEGMATVFESPGVRDPHGTTPKQRINRERFLWFGNFAKTRRKPKSLAFFVSDDSMFKSASLDAYSQAWAFTFFLIETRSASYSKYLRLMLNRDATQDYTAEQRLDDFKKAFGSDLETLDAQFLRFVEHLQ
jgi:hypothetical protein